MAGLKIYGTARSRTARVLWMANELGLEFEHVPLVMGDPQLKQPAFLKINPAGRIPAIDDNGFTLSESLAINLYLTMATERSPRWRRLRSRKRPGSGNGRPGP